MLSVDFAEHSLATGALLIFIYINPEHTMINFSKSSWQPVERSDFSQDLILPLDLQYHGLYELYAYDIEHNRRIANGIGYQASDGIFRVTDDQGTYLG